MSNFKHHAASEALGNALRELGTQREAVEVLEEQIKQKYLIPKGVKLLIPLLGDWDNKELERLITACEYIIQERESEQATKVLRVSLKAQLKTLVTECKDIGMSDAQIAESLQVQSIENL